MILRKNKFIINIKEHIKYAFNYEFCDEQLMLESVTHSSSSKKNYERLEFLGDAVIQLAVTEILLTKFNNCNEGELSRMRQYLVNKVTLSNIALGLQIDKILVSHNLNIKNSISLKKSIMADLFESILGGIYLDSGYQKCRRIVVKIFSKLIDSDSLIGGKDAKTKLQEYLQSKNLDLPNYKKAKLKSPSHDPKFKISCKIPVLEQTLSAISKTVKEGEQLVAQKLLDKIIHEE